MMSFKSAESVDAMIGRLMLCLACNLCCSSDVHNKLPQGISVIMQWQHSGGITISLTMLQLCVCVCARVCGVTAARQFLITLLSIFIFLQTDIVLPISVQSPGSQ